MNDTIGIAAAIIMIVGYSAIVIMNVVYMEKISKIMRYVGHLERMIEEYSKKNE